MNVQENTPITAITITGMPTIITEGQPHSMIQLVMMLHPTQGRQPQDMMHLLGMWRPNQLKRSNLIFVRRVQWLMLFLRIGVNCWCFESRLVPYFCPQLFPLTCKDTHFCSCPRTNELRIKINYSPQSTISFSNVKRNNAMQPYFTD